MDRLGPRLVLALVLLAAPASSSLASTASSRPGFDLLSLCGGLPGGCLLGRSVLLPPEATRLGHFSPGPADCLLAGMDDRCEDWSAMFDNANGYGGAGPDQVLAIATGGGRVFVTGGSYDDTTAHYDVATVAYDQATGAQVWVSRHDGPAHVLDAGYALALSNDGTRLFVAGTEDADLIEGGTILVLALDAATGAEVWSARAAPAEGATAYDLAVSPDGTMVHAAGVTHGGGHDAIVATFAATNGTLLWEARHDGGGGDVAYAVGAAEGRVFITGPSAGTGADYLTVAFRATDDPSTPADEAGQALWARRFDGGVGGGYDESTALTVSRDGSLVYVTGGSQRPRTEPTGPTPIAATTIAYDAATGAQRWLARHEPRPLTGSGQSMGFALALSPTDGRVFVAGMAPGPLPNSDYGIVTLAYEGTTGVPAWAEPFHPPGSTYGIGSSIAVTADGRTVITTGPSFEGFFSYKGDVATVAHDAATGAQRWAAKFTRAADDVADLLPYPSFAAAPGTRAFVTGTYVNYCCDLETGTDSNFSDYWTLAYRI